MIERTWINSGLLRQIGIDVNAGTGGELLTPAQEKLLSVGILIGNMRAMPIRERERWIKEKVGRSFLGFPDGITEAECDAIYVFSIDSKGFWEM